MRARYHLFLFAVLMAASPAAFAQVRIIQTNSGGDNIHIIDPVKNAVVGEVKGVPVNHGAAASPDGSRLYFSSEAERTLDVVDSKTLAIIKKIPLSGRPNNIFTSPDGARVYVAIVPHPPPIHLTHTPTPEPLPPTATPPPPHNPYVPPPRPSLIPPPI